MYIETFEPYELAGKMYTKLTFTGWPGLKRDDFFMVTGNFEVRPDGRAVCIVA